MEELQCHLLKALKTMDLSHLSSHSDGVMVRYIQNIVRNQYVHLSKEYKKDNGIVYEEDLNSYEAFQYLLKSSTASDYSQLFFSDIQNVLSEREYQVIMLLFHDDCTVTEAAKRIGRSRQAVNQIKNRALKKLKQKFVDTL